MRTVILAGLLSLPMHGVSMSAEPVDWNSVEFTKLKGTLPGVAVEETVNSLTYKLGSEYGDSLSSGNTWWCINQVLDLIVSAAVESRLADNPFENELIGKHSGHQWSFWSHLARVGQAVYDFGYPSVLDSQVLRVLAEMEAAFVPLLTPTDPAPRQNAEK